FFMAEDPTGYALWRSDGTAAGTALVEDVVAGELANVGGTLFFSAPDASGGVDLWRSDGTGAGTVVVKAFPSSVQSLHELTGAGGLLFFTALDAAGGWALWRSDGTAAGTVMLQSLPLLPPGVWPQRVPTGLTDVNGTLFFVAPDGTNGAKLWR